MWMLILKVCGKVLWHWLRSNETSPSPSSFPWVGGQSRFNPDPTEDDIYSPEFDAIWQVIKGWDIQREEGAGYAGANGTDVMTILHALRTLNPQQMAQALSPEVVYFAAFRLGAHATTGEYSNQEVPALLFMDAVDRFYNDFKAGFTTENPPVKIKD